MPKWLPIGKQPPPMPFFFFDFDDNLRFLVWIPSFFMVNGRFTCNNKKENKQIFIKFYFHIETHTNFFMLVSIYMLNGTLYQMCRFAILLPKKNVFFLLNHYTWIIRLFKQCLIHWRVLCSARFSGKTAETERNK